MILIITGGILKKFDLSATEIPAKALAAHMSRVPDDRFHVPWQHMESLVGSIFRETMSCEVTVTAHSKDGGVDFIGFDSESGPFVVQVKRYSKPVGVAIVRELVGAMVDFGHCHGILVSTSDFTSPANEYVERVTAAPENPYRIELVDGEKLLQYLDLFARGTPFVWRWEHLAAQTFGKSGEADWQEYRKRLPPELFG
jgi:hypothetical protein